MSSVTLEIVYISKARKDDIIGTFHTPEVRRLGLVLAFFIILGT